MNLEDMINALTSGERPSPELQAQVACDFFRRAVETVQSMDDKGHDEMIRALDRSSDIVSAMNRHAQAPQEAPWYHAHQRLIAVLREMVLMARENYLKK